ncbi:MAG TPA: iron-sulfur cluster assembly protein, partial [Ilumatobacteraceae bacterium]
MITVILLGERLSAAHDIAGNAVGALAPARFVPGLTVKLLMSANDIVELDAPTRDQILDLLRAVIDPELGADIVSLGMVPDVVISPADSNGKVDVTVWVKLTIGGCP